MQTPSSNSSPLFSPAARALLLAPARWRLVSTAVPPEERAVRHPLHESWARRNSHAHATREVMVALSGSGHQSLRGKVYPARPGTVFLFNAMEPHDQNYRPPHPEADHLWLTFMPDRVLAMFWRVGRGKRRAVELWRRWFSLAELGLASDRALFADSLPPGTAADAVRARILAGVALVAAALVEWGDKPPAAESETSHFREDVMAMIQRYIREADGKGCRLESLARLAGYGKFHFLRLFRAYAGLTPMRYAEGCRREAYARLAGVGYSQKAIAEALGFAHPSALTRWRRRDAGCSISGAKGRVLSG
jgi:AraC-like DNA-binding protein